MKKGAISILLIVVMISVSFTGCYPKVSEPSLKIEDRLPALLEEIEKTVNNSNVQNSYEIYKDTDRFTVFMSVEDKENFYNIRLSVFSVYAKGEFLLTVNWSEPDDNIIPEIDEIFGFEDITLQLISNLIYKITGNETKSLISAQIIKLRRIVKERDFLNKPLTEELCFKYDDDLIENEIGIYSEISKNYGEYIAIDGKIKNEV